MKPHLLTAIAAILACAASQPLAAATRTWTGGGADANWTTADNWGGTAPAPGDDLVFPDALLPSMTNTNNFPAGTAFNSIAIQRNGYSISGNSIALQAGVSIAITSGSSTLLTPLVLSGSHTFSSTGLYGLGAISVPAGTTLTFNSALGSAVVQGSISGAGSIQKTGTGGLDLGDNSAFTGTITATAGEVTGYHANALGSTAAGTTLTDTDFKFLPAASAVCPENITLQGTSRLYTFNASQEFSGTITINTTSTMFVQAQGGAVTFSGAIQGTQAPTVLGDLVLSGSAPNTFPGRLDVSGAVTLSKSPNVIAVPNGLLLTTDDSCSVLAPGQINGSLGLNGTGSLNLNGHNTSVTDLSFGTGTIQTGAGILTVTGSVGQGGGTGTITGNLHIVGAARSISSSNIGDVLNVNAVVTGASGASWFRSGLGKVVLGAAGSLTAMTNAQGETVINGAWPSLAITFQAGTISGTGAVLAITKSSAQAGVVSPGQSAGKLTTGSFLLNSNTTLAIELNGVTQGSGYDALVVTGAASSSFNLGILSVTLGGGFLAPVNTKFRIVDVNGTAPGGVFSGMANNSTFTVGAYTFRINYFTGTGNNDVELTVTASPFTATTRTWSGAGGDALWTNPANWSGGAAPVPGDNLIFPSNALQFSTTNDFPSGTFLGFLNSTGAYTFGGNSVVLSTFASNPGTGSTTMVQMSVEFVTGQTITPTSGTTLWAGDLVANGGTFQLNPGTGATLQIGSVISGSSAITKSGAGFLVLQGNNTFTGDFTLSSGTLQISHGNAMGPGGVTRLTAGSCSVSGGITVPEAFEINSACTLNTSPGSTTFSGPITTAGTAGTSTTIQGLPGGFVTLSGAISGPRGLALIGGATFTISGPASNTFAEFLSADAPVVNLGKSSGAEAVPAGTELRIQGNQHVHLAADHQIGGAVFIKAGGVLHMNSFSDTIPSLDLEVGTVTGGTGTLTLAGPLNAHTAACTVSAKLAVTGTSVWTVADPGSLNDLTVSNGIAGGVGASITRNGPGRLLLTGISTILTMQLDSGTTIFDGSFGGTVSLNGGTAGGIGSISQMTATASGGVVSPGSSPGSLEISTINWTPATTLAIEINGTAAGSFDRITSDGTHTIGGSLQVSVVPGALIPIGTVFRILENFADLPGETAGAFTGLANNATLTSSGYTFRINYGVGIGGDDIELTLVAVAPTGNTRTWTGAGGNNNWTTAANWTGSIAPVPGDALLFPSGASQTTNANDFPAATSFASVTVNAAYNLSGNATVLESLAADPGGANVICTLPCTFVGARTVSCGSGLLVLNGGIQSDAGSLAFAAASSGTISVGGTIGGAVSIVKNGSGDLGLLAGNSFTGDVTINGGRLISGNANGLGPGGTTHLPGGTLEVNGTYTLPENFVLHQNGKISHGNGAVTLSGTVATTAASGPGPCYLEGSSIATLVITGVISGPLPVTFEGAGNKTLSGSALNTMTGLVTVNGGTLTLARTGGGVAIPSGTDLRVEQNRSVILGADHQIGGAVLVRAGGLLNLNNFSDSINGLTLEAAIVSTGTGTLTLAGPLTAQNAACTINGKLQISGTANWTVHDSGAPDDLTINAALSGTATPLLIRGGAGRLVLTSNSSTLGNIRLDAGDTAFNGNGGFNVEITGGEMSGTGSVVSVVAQTGGVIAPGNPGPTVGTLGIASVDLRGGSETQFNLTGTGHDVINTDTPENKIGGALQLSLALGFHPAPGTQFVIIANASGTGALNTGTFSGKPEGAVFLAGGKVFRIDYQSGTDGDNDDVMLTCVTPPAPVLTNSSITDIGGGLRNVQLSGTGVIGAVYFFEESLDLINWSSVTSTTAAPTTGAWSFNLNRPAAAPRMFFRARMQ